MVLKKLQQYQCQSQMIKLSTACKHFFMPKQEVEGGSSSIVRLGADHRGRAVLPSSDTAFSGRSQQVSLQQGWGLKSLPPFFRG